MIPPTVQMASIYATQFASTPLKLPSEGYQDVTVCCAASPSDFYVHYKAFRESLATVNAKVKQSAGSSDPLDNFVAGLPCIAKYHEDGLWYRAQLLKVLSDEILVRYVDYGHVARITHTHETIRRMLDTLSQYPFYAVRVCLAGVAPVAGSHWSAAVCEKFFGLVVNSEFYMEALCLEADVVSARFCYTNGMDLVARMVKEHLGTKTAILVPAAVTSSAEDKHFCRPISAPPYFTAQLPSAPFTRTGSANILLSSHSKVTAHAAPRERTLAKPTSPQPTTSRAALHQHPVSQRSTCETSRSKSVVAQFKSVVNDEDCLRDDELRERGVAIPQRTLSQALDVLADHSDDGSDSSTTVRLPSSDGEDDEMESDVQQIGQPENAVRAKKPIDKHKYTDEDCQKLVNCKSSLARHQLSRLAHKSPHRCPQCNYTCGNNCSLTEHMEACHRRRQHTKRDVFTCNVCSVSYANMPELQVINVTCV
jgi:hypothetical protein